MIDNITVHYEKEGVNVTDNRLYLDIIRSFNFARIVD